MVSERRDCLPPSLSETSSQAATLPSMTSPGFLTRKAVARWDVEVWIRALADPGQVAYPQSLCNQFSGTRVLTVMGVSPLSWSSGLGRGRRPGLSPVVRLSSPETAPSSVEVPPPGLLSPTGFVFPRVMDSSVPSSALPGSWPTRGGVPRPSYFIPSMRSPVVHVSSTSARCIVLAVAAFVSPHKCS